MNQFEQKLLNYIQDHQVHAELLRFNQSCHSVAEAALAAGTTPDNLIKNICLIDEQGNLIVAIVKGEDRVDFNEIGKALNIRPPRIASTEEIILKTGYPCGGVPSFSYEATFLIDPRVMEKEAVYTGGGSPYALIKITPSELLQANRGLVVRIRK
jgi:Cys-tRNA(Pro)/Cys-tRNA(Cys) deacylase